MTDRFMTMRAALHRNLEALSSLSWEHIIKQVCGSTAEMCS